MRATHQPYLIDLESRRQRETKPSMNLRSAPTCRKNYRLFRVTTQSWQLFGMTLFIFFCLFILAGIFGFSPYLYALLPALTDVALKTFGSLMCLLLLVLVLESIH
jgi:hypothetical protein